MDKKQIVSRDPQIVSGTLVFAGTRVPVQILIDYLKAGETLDRFFEGFPTVSREQAEAMRVPLDKNVDRLRRGCSIPASRFSPRKKRRWQGKSNGELLRSADSVLGPAGRLAAEPPPLALDPAIG